MANIGIDFNQAKVESKTNRSVRNDNDLGFGRSATKENIRMVNRDGSFNVLRTGAVNSFLLNVFHDLIRMKWIKFIGITTLTYAFINIVFASIFTLLGPHSLNGIEYTGMHSYFWDCFFFSTQTFTTVGYGHISPNGLIPNIVASIESYLGLLGFALATGLLYGKFSRPHARIAFSKNAIIAPYQNGKGLMFRIANARNNQLIDVKVVLFISYNKTDPTGMVSRSFEALTLERESINFFPYNWTIVHPINSSSPVFGWTEEEFKFRDSELLILIKGTDDTYSTEVHSRSSYTDEEILWGRKFTNMMSESNSGKVVVELNKIDDMIEVDLDK